MREILDVAIRCPGRSRERFVRFSATEQRERRGVGWTGILRSQCGSHFRGHLQEGNGLQLPVLKTETAELVLERLGLRDEEQVVLRIRRIDDELQYAHVLREDGTHIEDEHHEDGQEGRQERNHDAPVCGFSDRESGIGENEKVHEDEARNEDQHDADSDLHDALLDPRGIPPHLLDEVEGPEEAEHADYPEEAAYPDDLENREQT